LYRIKPLILSLQPVSFFPQELKTSRKEIEEFTRLSIARAEREAIRQKEEVVEAIKQANESREGEVEILNLRIGDHKNQLQVQFEKLTYQEQQLELKAARIAHVEALYQHKEKEVQDLRNQNRGNGGGCTIF